MERPTVRHFAEGTRVDSKKNKFFIEVNENSHDKWYLMGMKPNSTTVNILNIFLHEIIIILSYISRKKML